MECRKDYSAITNIHLFLGGTLTCSETPTNPSEPLCKRQIRHHSHSWFRAHPRHRLRQWSAAPSPRPQERRMRQRPTNKDTVIGVG